jgi:hypothetical protein
MAVEEEIVAPSIAMPVLGNPSVQIAPMGVWSDAARCVVDQTSSRFRFDTRFKS